MRHTPESRLRSFYHQVMDLFHSRHVEFHENLAHSIDEWAESNDGTQVVNTDPVYLRVIWTALREGRRLDLLEIFAKTLAKELLQFRGPKGRTLRRGFSIAFGDYFDIRVAKEL